MTLDAGDVFLLRDFSSTGTSPHYRIVVHKTSSSELVLVYPSTKLDKIKKACCRDEKFGLSVGIPLTYVEIPPGSCPALVQVCAVNCNKAYVRTEDECVNGPDFKLMNGKIHPAIIAKIRDGIKDSDVVSEIVIDALAR
jgi:hypothetical protein